MGDRKIRECAECLKRTPDADPRTWQYHGLKGSCPRCMARAAQFVVPTLWGYVAEEEPLPKKRDLFAEIKRLDAALARSAGVVAERDAEIARLKDAVELREVEASRLRREASQKLDRPPYPPYWDVVEQRDRAVARSEKAEHEVEILTSAKDGFAKSLDEMAKALRAKDDQLESEKLTSGMLRNRANWFEQKCADISAIIDRKN